MLNDHGTEIILTQNDFSLVAEKAMKHRQWRIQDFPEEGAPTLGGGGGASTYNFVEFSQKLYEIERIWIPSGGGGARPKFYYVDPPLTVDIHPKIYMKIF